jgi:DNA-binding response OmpR family regulator
METKKSILIVEDDKPIAHALALKLTHEGFEVAAASDGEQALEMLAKNKFDLMLMDLVMPRMDGFRLLERMKEGGYTTPVVVTSNLSQEEDMKRSKELGAVGYIVKSNTPIVEIVAKVREILG